MLPLAPAGSAYTAEEVAEVLAGLRGPRRVSYRFERMDYNGKTLGPLQGISDFAIEYNALADIKRTCSFAATPRAELDYLRDRIKPWWRLAMPDGGYVEWPVGVFVLSTPSRKLEKGYTTRAVDGYDLGQILADGTTARRLSIPAGKNYITAIQELVGGAPGFTLKLTPTTKTLPAAMEWEPGTTYAKVVNDLLAAINYVPVHFDEAGVMIAKPYLSPSESPATFVYNTDARSIISGNPTQTLDLFSIPNRWILVRSDPDVPEMVGVYENQNPASPTSIPARGRTIVDFRTDDDAPDEATLAAKAKRLGQESSQVFEEIEFETLAMPIHGHGDVYLLGIEGLALAPEKFSETKWSLDLTAGSTMKHTARRVVAL